MRTIERVFALPGGGHAPEDDYSAFLQYNTAQDDAARCCPNGPRDEVLVLARGSTGYWTYGQRAVR